jgi:hypothetical protein
VAAGSRLHLHPDSIWGPTTLQWHTFLRRVCICFPNDVPADRYGECINKSYNRVIVVEVQENSSLIKCMCNDLQNTT